MDKRETEILRGQIYAKMGNARTSVMFTLEKIQGNIGTMGADEMAAEVYWLNKWTNDWKLWAKVYSELFDISEPLSLQAKQAAVTTEQAA